MTARCENEIVTLRGEACLVRQLPKLPLIAKIAEIEKQRAHRGDAEARRRSESGIRGMEIQPQISADERRSETMQSRDAASSFVRSVPDDPTFVCTILGN